MPRPATANGITKLAHGYRWRVMVGGQRITGTAITESAARLARAEAEIRYGGNPNLEPTVAELVAAHMAHSARAETTLENWRWAYEILPAPFLRRKACDVSPAIVAALWRQLGGQPPHRLVKLANLCSTAWQDALAVGAVQSNPWRAIAPPTPPPADEIVPPDPQDVAALIAAADPQFRVWLLLAAFTGARGGELCALRWDDVDWSGGSIMIKRSLTRSGTETATKTGRKGQRRVELDDDTLGSLKAHHEAAGGPWIFPRPDGHPMRPDGAAKRLQRLCRITGVDVSPHDLRHFAVTQWLAIGVPIPDVAALIGDNPKTVMQTYAHHVPSRRRDMVARLARLVRDA